MKHLDLEQSVIKTSSIKFDFVLYNADFTAALTALLLAATGKKVCLIFQDDFMFSNVRYVRYINEQPVNGYKQKSTYSQKQLDYGATILNKISPNTFYFNKCYAISWQRNILKVIKDALTLKEIPPKANWQKSGVFADGCGPSENHIVRVAKAYRMNETRFYVSVFKTLENLGSIVIRYSQFTGMSPNGKSMYFRCNKLKRNFEVNNAPNMDFDPIGLKLKKRIFLKTPINRSPIKQPVYINNDKIDIYLFNRYDYFCISQQAYEYSDKIAAISGEISAIADIINESIDGAAFRPTDFTVQSVNTVPAGENPCVSLLKASDNVAKLLNTNKNPLSYFDKFKLVGSNFDFDPTPFNIIEYADRKYDEVKLMNVDINRFKTTVFDFGTEIDEIINNFYDIYRDFNDGTKAFLEAVKKYRLQHEGNGVQLTINNKQ